MKNKIKIALLSSSLFLPLVSHAQLSQTRALFQEASSIINRIVIPLVFVLALLFFFWGVAMYIKDEGQGKEEGRRIMVWGVVALFVISSVWGLVNFIKREIGGDIYNNNIQIPTINGGSGSDLNL